MTARIFAAFDAARIGALTATLTETGGGGATGAINLTGYYIYTKNVSTVDATCSIFETALKTALDVVGNATYTVTLNPTTRRVTISGAGGGVTSFALTVRSATFDAALGLSGAITGALSYLATNAPYYFKDGSIGGVTDYTGYVPREYGDIAVELLAHDGTVYGQSQEDTARAFEATFMLEPASAIDDYFATSLEPWTWFKFFKHVRNTEIFVLEASSLRTHIALLRAEGVRLVPGFVGGEYFAVIDVPLLCFHLGDAT